MGEPILLGTFCVGGAKLMVRSDVMIQESMSGPFCALSVVVAVAVLNSTVLADSSLDRLDALFDKQVAAGKYREAETTARRMADVAVRNYGRQSRWMAAALNRLSIARHGQGRYAEAVEAEEQCLDIRRQVDGTSHRDFGGSLMSLGRMYRDAGRFDDAERVVRQSIPILENALGREHQDVGHAHLNLGIICDDVGRYPEAERYFMRAWSIWADRLDADSPLMMILQNSMAGLRHHQGRYVEAERLYKKMIRLERQSQSPDHAHLHAASLLNLATLYGVRGEHADAERLCKRALSIQERFLGVDHPDLAYSLDSLASNHMLQGRFADAEPLVKRALAKHEKTMGPNHPQVAIHLLRLALIHRHRGDLLDAEACCQRAQEILEKSWGAGHEMAITTVRVHGGLYHRQGKHAEAESCLRQLLEVAEGSLGLEHPEVAKILADLGEVTLRAERPAEAEEFLERAVALAERIGLPNGSRSRMAKLRAQAAWRTGKRDAALEYLRDAMRFAESHRAHSSGAEHQVAQAFGAHLSAFEQMVAWQVELDDIETAHNAIERSRAQSLVDQLEAHGSDLLAGIPRDEAERLLRASRAAEMRIISLERQLRMAARRMDLSQSQRKRQRDQLLAELRRAREAFTDARGDVRNASPTVRLVAGRHREPVSLERLKQWVSSRNALLVQYVLGEDGGYVLVVPADGVPRLQTLTIDRDQASLLGIEPGPLIARSLSAALTDAHGTGLLQQIRISKDSAQAAAAISKLALLWTTLVPEQHRQALLDGRYQNDRTDRWHVGPIAVRDVGSRFRRRSGMPTGCRSSDSLRAFGHRALELG